MGSVRGSAGSTSGGDLPRLYLPARAGLLPPAAPALWHDFVAFVPPPQLRAELADGLAGALAEVPQTVRERARWVDRSRWHVTLAFLGTLEPFQLEPLRAGLAVVAGQLPPTELTLSGAGRFTAGHSGPGGGRDRVIWAKVLADGLGELLDQVSRACARAGAAAPDRDPVPHLTLARSRDRRGADFTGLLDALAALRVGPAAVSQIHLLRSRGRRAHEPYEELGRWPLAG